ncbi:unnamed protein product [Rhodiola kirilowii]
MVNGRTLEARRSVPVATTHIPLSKVVIHLNLTARYHTKHLSNAMMGLNLTTMYHMMHFNPNLLAAVRFVYRAFDNYHVFEKSVVLSKNPVRDVGKSLEKMKSLTKLSLSHCQLQSLGSSLKSCSELKELRLAHNELTALPSELAHNARIHTLDLGNNSIINWSDLKVLNSLTNLRNLNLHGNPIADKDKFVNKVKRLIPNLQILNSKPLDKYTNDKKVDAELSAVSFASEVGKQEKEGEYAKDNKKPKHRKDLDNEHGDEDTAEKKSKSKRQKTDNKQKQDELSEKKSKEARKVGDDVIDDTETPFSELFAHNLKSLEDTGMKLLDNHKDADQAIVKLTSKKKKPKSLASGSKTLEILAPSVDVGLGGPSTWE